MESGKLQSCSAYEIIMIVHELHKMGYEQLRLKSGLSPSGMSWRWHIYPKVFFCNDNLYECKGDCLPFKTIEGSTNQGMPENDVIINADYFIRTHAEFLEMAKGEDKEYVRWFQTIVEHAKLADFPISYSEYFDSKEWIFINSKEDLSYPPYIPV